MGCGCRGNRARSTSGSWEVTYPDGSTKTFLSQIEASREATRRGGTVRRV